MMNVTIIQAEVWIEMQRQIASGEFKPRWRQAVEDRQRERDEWRRQHLRNVLT